MVKDLTNIFKELDTDGNGTLSYDEIKQGFNKYYGENKITENIKIRSDFLSAFANYDYTEIANKLEYALSEQDISNLAFIYKSGEHEEDIENLLQYCNFHKECGDFINGKCEEYFLGEPPKTEKNKIKPNERY